MVNIGGLVLIAVTGLNLISNIEALGVNRVPHRPCGTLGVTWLWMKFWKPVANAIDEEW